MQQPRAPRQLQVTVTNPFMLHHPLHHQVLSL